MTNFQFDGDMLYRIQTRIHTGSLLAPGGRRNTVTGSIFIDLLSWLGHQVLQAWADALANNKWVDVFLVLRITNCDAIKNLVTLTGASVAVARFGCFLRSAGLATFACRSEPSPEFLNTPWKHTNTQQSIRDLPNRTQDPDLEVFTLSLSPADHCTKA